MNKTPLKIGIAGKKDKTANYVKACEHIGLSPLVSLSISQLSTCDGLLLPGGGDMNPHFYGQKNIACGPIDDALDILQLQALDFFVHSQKPVLGICRGMQLINAYFGGTLIQDLPNAKVHKATSTGDALHLSSASPNTILSNLYGETFVINSSHHQAVDKLGKDLRIIQKSEDDIVEAFIHTKLPILAVQWHPERFDVVCNNTKKEASLSGSHLIGSFFTETCL